MVHDGDYYSIFNKENILSLLDDIEQNIIRFSTETSYDTILCCENIWAMLLILQRIWRQYQVGRIAHVRIYERQQKNYAAVHELCYVNLNSDTVAS